MPMPQLLHFVTEAPRMMRDMAKTPVALPDLLKEKTDDGQPILVVQAMAPAMGTLEMRGVLRLMGHKTHSMGELDMLKQGRHAVRNAVIAKVEELSDKYGEPITIAGWCYGGPFVRMAGHAVPDKVRQVITMGALVQGAPYPKEFAWTGTEPLPVPTTAIYSRSDGYFKPEQVMPPPGPQVERVEVPTSHNGMANHPATLRVVADRLSQPKDSWRPYAGPGADPHHTASSS